MKGAPEDARARQLLKLAELSAGKWPGRLDHVSETIIQTTLSLRSNARLRGRKLAMLFGETMLDWNGLEDRVARLAGVLRSCGVNPGDRVCVLAFNSTLYLKSFWAIPWAGGIIVPINTRLTAREVAFILDHCRPRTVLVDAGNAPLLRAALEAAAEQPQVLEFEKLDDLIAATDRVGDAGRSDADPASIFYTGGTTGRSKGVVLSHANHVINGLSTLAGLGTELEDARYLHVAPLFHVADALFVHTMTLVGACHVVLPRFDPVETMRAIERHSVTDVILIPTMIQSLLACPELQQFDLSSLKRLFYGGMPMPEATARLLTGTLPHCGMIQLYGQTEASPNLTMLRPDEHDFTGATRQLRSAGRPLPGTEIAICNDEGQLLPPGAVGEVVARSGSVMLGYWEDPAQSAATLKAGWLHTGDSGYFDEDGFLYIVDRIKDMIITGGENVYSIEVERAITLHPDVAQCAVIGLPDSRWGERVHAVVVLRDGRSLDEAALIEHCRNHIGGYKIPRSFEWRDRALPLSGAGKVLKRELRAEALRSGGRL